MRLLTPLPVFISHSVSSAKKNDHTHFADKQTKALCGRAGTRPALPAEFSPGSLTGQSPSMDLVLFPAPPPSSSACWKGHLRV